MTSALAKFIGTINATGGIHAFSDGTFAPEGDIDWIDLGEVYMAACEEAEVEPLYYDHHLFPSYLWEREAGRRVPEEVQPNRDYSDWVHEKLKQENQP